MMKMRKHFLLEDIAGDGFEILYNNNWLPARFYEQDILQICQRTAPFAKWGK